MQKTLLVRRPDKKFSRNKALALDFSGLSEEPEREIDLARMSAQWKEYVQVFADRRWRIVELDDRATTPKELFIEHDVAIYHTVALFGRAEGDDRRAYQEGLRQVVSECGFAVAEVKQPAMLSGGDVLFHGNQVHVGRGVLTNAEGVGLVRRLLTPLGATVIASPLAGARFLKKAATVLPDGTAIGISSELLEARVFDRFIEAPEPLGASVVALSPNELLVSAAAPGTAALLQNLGFRVVTVDISEFELMDGCVSSLSIRLRDQL